MARTPRISTLYDVPLMTPEDLEGQWVILTQGLPGSGKTSWAKKMEEAFDSFHRVNRDEIRRELGFKYDPRREAEVSAIQDQRICAILASGESVISDDTYLDPHHIKAREQQAEHYGAQVKVVSFMHVPVEECIKRDLLPDRQRADQTVGKDVIETLYAKYWSKRWVPENIGSTGIHVVLCDLDGTLCELPHGVGYPAAYNRDYSFDRANKPVLSLIHRLIESGTSVVLLSGREDKDGAREQTEQWCREHGLEPLALVLRDADDMRQDFIVKKELYMRHIQGRYTVLYVVDDRPSVVRMWRNDLGLPVFQVKPNVEF